ncbi:MAG: aminotransferase class I/II-fold pyridoxal phosphate-dependent enzyme [Pseudomonadota bacterium]
MPAASHRISQISQSNLEGWEVYVEALNRQREGKDPYMVCIGDHDFPTPFDSVAACKEALDAGHHNYSEIQGQPRLLEAIAKVASSACGMPVGTDEVITMPGGQGGLYASMQAVLNPGDHVVIVSPYYVTYPNTVRAAGGTFTLVDARSEDGFQPRATDIEAAIQPNTKAVMINSPNNPTCAIYSRETLEAICDVCIRHDLWLISDEVYWSLSKGNHVSPRSLPGMKERTLVIHSMSKSHGMTGWRFGWIVAPEAMIGHLVQHNLVSTYGMNDFVSRAVTVALEQEIGVHDIADTYRKRGEMFLEELSGANDLRILNEAGGMYFMVDIRAIAQDAQKFAFALLEAENVAIMPGDSFGPSARGHIRISLCQPEDRLREAAKRLRRFTTTYSE